MTTYKELQHAVQESGLNRKEARALVYRPRMTVGVSRRKALATALAARRERAQ